jgi:hypothetical protein
MKLQQFCKEKELTIKTDLAEFENKEKAQLTLTKEYVEKMLDSWLQGF